ncbi:MAG: DUF924 family protein [Pseudomonadota bacterium]
MQTPKAVLDFWLTTVGEAGWYKADPELDAQITAKFQTSWEAAEQGGLTDWCVTPRGTLAYLFLTDQFPRNMFRGDARSFATDTIAVRAAKKAVERSWDLRIPEPERQFFYLPMMHAESLPDQERSVRLIAERMPECGASNLLHARAHRRVIRQFGRFPYRNDALGRETTRREASYLAEGGYGSTVRAIEAEDATAAR